MDTIAGVHHERAAMINWSSIFNSALSSALCAALVACASTSEPASPNAGRGRAPQGYDKTITSYFAFKVRGPKNNVEISVDRPEPSDCPLDGYITSTRGWVVPVVYATRAGAMSGKEPIYITAKQYYFWFRGDTIAGITPRMELCPGSGTSLIEVSQALAAAEGSPSVATSLSTAPKALGREDAGMLEQPTRSGTKDRAMMAGALKHDTKPGAAKKTVRSSGAVRHAIKKVGKSRKKVGDPVHKVEVVPKKQRLRAMQA